MEGIAIVTGATGAIGTAICEVLAKAGMEVVGWDLRVDQGGPEGAELRRVDVTDQVQVGAAAEELRDRDKPVAVLVNNAGILGSKHTLDKLPLEDWEAVMRTNLTSAFLCSQAVVPMMRERGFGRVIHISSLGAQTGARFASAAYTASKGGLLAITKTMSREFAPDGITVNAIAPARIDGSLFAEAYGDKKAAEAETIPVRRFGDPLDVAHAVAYLASVEAGFVTAQTLNVNGGLWAV
jgi:2-hydroxycyclohexanecarboxyl-CoA dehydrogenase